MIESADLARIVIFQDLPAEDLERIKHLVFERTFKTGSTLFMEGMQGEVLYLVKSGKIEIMKRKGADDMLIATLGPGEFVGEMSVIDNERRSATARVAEDSVLMVITKQVFQDIIRTIPEGASRMLLAIIKIVNRRLREANRKLTAR
jgi:CRP/FNR family transcriptional regulator, cyclic AMP receptor protein